MTAATPPSGRPRASIVIPAYNEGRVIGACLAALRDAPVGPLDVVVAANGCTDDTVAVARTFDGVRVVDVPTASKIAALDAGDRAATTFPRIFLDADIVLEPGALESLIAALETPEPRVASPLVRFDTRGCSLPVRLFYDAYRELPYVRSGMIGLGIYGLSESGRARFGSFPDVDADDLFVQRLFAPDERITSPGRFVVRAPRDLRNLLRVRTRVARGNATLAQDATPTTAPDADFSATTGGTLRSLADTARTRPTLAPAVATYAGVVTAARLLARRSGSGWQRDDSTR